jgi:Mn2+/Fe2+ NRAMP family transporter
MPARYQPTSKPERSTALISWLLVLLLPITYFIQEMVVRLGIATVRDTLPSSTGDSENGGDCFSLVDLQLLNFLTLVTEFAAIALALEHLNMSPLIAVPVAACALTLLVLTGSYRRWERIVVFLCLLDLARSLSTRVLRPAKF